MTWFCVSKIFGPVGPEKTVICDRSAFAERSSRELFCGTGCGIMTWFCVSKIFGPVGPEKTVICDRSALAERSCRGRTKGRKARMSARPGPFTAWGWICAKPNPPLLGCGRRDGKPVPYYPLRHGFAVPPFAAYGDPPDIAYAMPSPKGRGKVRRTDGASAGRCGHRPLLTGRAKIRRTYGADGGTGNPSPTVGKRTG